MATAARSKSLLVRERRTALEDHSDYKPAQSSSSRADFALSFITACMHLRWRRAALLMAQSLSGGGERAREGARTPLAPRMHVPRLERVLLVSQLFAWNLSCLGSLIVCVIFWATLVRETYAVLSKMSFPAVCMSHARWSFCCEEEGVFFCPRVNASFFFSSAHVMVFP